MRKHHLILMSQKNENARRLLEEDDKPWYIPEETKEFLKQRAEHKCRICRGRFQKSRNDLHIDHITPVSRGGNCVFSNLQVLCSWCNLSKYNHGLDPRSYDAQMVIPIHLDSVQAINRRILEKVECDTC